MIIVNSGNTDYVVLFDHVRSNREGTVCTIASGQKGQLLKDMAQRVSGRSFLNPKDKNFNKAIGRYVALDRVLDEGKFTTEQSVEIVNVVSGICKLQNPDSVSS